MGYELLPLPVASLTRRARNAKSPKERHDTAFYAWEASIRLTVAARPPPDRSGLAMASLGHWVGALSLEDQLLDAAPLLAAFSLFSEVGLDKNAKPRAVTPRKLLDVLPPYRNHVMGHGAARSPEFYDASAQILIAGLEAAWAAGVFFKPGEVLVYVDNVELSETGEPRARVVELSGLASFVRPSPMVVDGGCRPRRLYLASSTGLRSLHPWLLYVEAELREQVLFFNGRARSSTFLDYLSGESLRGKALTALFPEVEKELDSLFSNVPRLGPVEEGSGQDPALFGDYRILGELGQGGMGIVYLARQDSLDRLVALKVLPAEQNEDPVAVARFDREINALSRCDHPNVVKILASGKAKGRRYYVMELVQGADLGQISQALTTHPDFSSAFSSAAEGSRTARQKLYEGVAVLPEKPPPALPPPSQARDRALALLFRDAARGIQHLHDNGILHRDIKPSNLMVTESDQRIVVMDLGLAMVKDATRALTRDHTAILGTLRYMPPEQLQRSLLQLDARADVYALGATLYELLADRPMFDGDSEPQLIEQILRATPANVSKVQPAISRDLGLIVQKAVDKDPALRYQSAEAFARDLDNFLQGRPVEARPPSLAYLAQVTVRRNKGLSAAVLGAVLFGLIGTVVFIQGLRQANRREHAQRLAAEESTAAARRSLAELHEEKGREALLAGDKGRAAVLLSAALSSGLDGAGLRRMLPLALTPFDAERAHLRGHVAEVGQVAFHPDDSIAATGSADGTVKLWEAKSGRLIASFDSAMDAVTWLAFSADGNLLASGSADGKVRLIDPVNGATRVLEGHRSAVSAGAFGKDGRRLVTASDGGEVIVWDVATGKPARTIEAHTGRIWTVDVSPDGTRFVTASADKTARLWELERETPAAVLLGHGSGVLSASFSPSGREVLTASLDGTAMLWDAQSARPRAKLEAAQRELAVARWSPDGQRVATAGSDGTLRLWDASGTPLCRGAGHADRATDLVFTPDGRRLLSAGEDGAIRVWSPECRSLEQFRAGPSPVRALAMSRDGATLLAGSADGEARLWDPRAGVAAEVLSGEGEVLGARFSPDGTAVVSSHASGVARLWDASGVLTSTLEPAQPAGTYVTDARFSPDGSLVLSVSGGAVQLWERRTSRRIRTFEAPGHRLNSAHFDTTGTRVVALSSSDRYWGVWNVGTGRPLLEQESDSALVSVEWLGSEGPLLLWGTNGASTADAKTGEVIAEFDHPKPSVVTATVDGHRIATGDCAGELRIFEVASARLLMRLKDRPGCLRHAEFGNTGRWLAVADTFRRVVIWDAQSGTLHAVLEGHPAEVVALAFSADDLTLATADERGQVRLWDAGRGRFLAILDGHQDHVTGLQFGPSDGRLVSSSWDGSVRLWNVPTEGRTAEQVAAVVAGRAPWRLDGERLVARDGERSKNEPPSAASALRTRGEREQSQRASIALLAGEVPDALAEWDGLAGVDDAETFAQRFAASRLEGHSSVCRFAPGSLDALRVVKAGAGVVFTFGETSGWVTPERCEIKSLPKGAPGEAVRCASDTLKVAATSDAEGTVRVWSLGAGKLLNTFRGHSGKVNRCWFSADDGLLATAGEDGTARLWDLRENKALATMIHDEPVSRATLSVDGRTLLTAAGKVVKVWDAHGGELRQTFPATAEWANVFASSKVDRAVAASSRRTCGLDLVSGKERWCLEAPDGRPASVAISANGKVVVAEQAAGRIAVLDAETGTVRASLRTAGGQLIAIAVNDQGTHVAASTEHGLVRLWEAGGRLVDEWPIWTREWDWLAIAPGAGRVIAASADGSVRVLKVRPRRDVEVALVPAGAIARSTASADGRRILTVADDGSVRVHDARTGREVAILVEPSIATEPTSGETKAVASASGAPEPSGDEGKKPLVANTAVTPTPEVAGNGNARPAAAQNTVATPPEEPSGTENTQSVPEPNSPVAAALELASDANTKPNAGLTAAAEPSGPVDTKQAVAAITAVALDATGSKALIARTDATTQLWAVSPRKLLRTLMTGEDVIRAAAFSEDGSRVVLAGDERVVRIFDPATGRELQALSGGHVARITAVAFNPSGDQIASGSADRSAKLWKVGADQPVALLYGHSGQIASVSFSADGARLITTGEDGAARTWDTSTGLLESELSGHLDQVNAAVSVSAGRWLATATRDGVVQLWDARTTRPLFKLEWPNDEILGLTDAGDDRLTLVTRSGMLRWLTLPRSSQPLDEREWERLRALGSFLRRP